MSKVLEALYWAEPISIDESLRHSKKYQEQDAQFSRASRAFEAQLKAAAPQLFQSYDDLCSQRNTLFITQESIVFQIGFCLGVTIMQEVSQHMEREL